MIAVAALPRPRRIAVRGILSLVLIVASAAFIAACGDGRLSKRAYIDKMNSIQKPLEEAGKSLGTDPKKIAAELPKLQKQLDAVYNKMKVVKPPKEYAKYHADFLDGVKMMSKAFGELGDAIKSPSSATSTTAVAAKITEAMTKIETARSGINSNR